MSRFVYEGQTRIQWVTTIADIAEPTPTELNAGTNLTPFVTKDGLNTPQNPNMVDSATIAETFDAQLVGSWGGALELTMFRDSVAADDDAWTLFVYGTNGFVVVRRGVAVATTFAADDRVEVYPAQMHQPIMQPSAANEQQRFTVSLAVTSQPNLKAVCTV